MKTVYTDAERVAEREYYRKLRGEMFLALLASGRYAINEHEKIADEVDTLVKRLRRDDMQMYEDEEAQQRYIASPMS